MDHTSNTSQRIRPILQAMERSIDDARRRRSGTIAAGHSNGGMNSSQASPAMGTPQPTAGQPGSPAISPLDRSIAANAQGAPAKTASLHTQPALGSQSARPTPNTAPSSPQQLGTAHTAPANPDQPVRLKARPKRWLPATA